MNYKHIEHAVMLKKQLEQCLRVMRYIENIQKQGKIKPNGMQVELHENTNEVDMFGVYDDQILTENILTSIQEAATGRSEEIATALRALDIDDIP